MPSTPSRVVIVTAPGSQPPLPGRPAWQCYLCVWRQVPWQPGQVGCLGRGWSLQSGTCWLGSGPNLRRRRRHILDLDVPSSITYVCACFIPVAVISACLINQSDKKLTCSVWSLIIRHLPSSIWWCKNLKYEDLLLFCNLISFRVSLVKHFLPFSDISRQNDW